MNQNIIQVSERSASGAGEAEVSRPAPAPSPRKSSPGSRTTCGGSWWPTGSATARRRRSWWRCCGRPRPRCATGWGATEVTAHPRIASWRAAFKALGINPKDFRCSVEAMARRALKGQQLPSINALVDIGNILSLRHLVPMGGHAIDHAVEGYLLRPATGPETFVPFGTDQAEHPDPGEIIYAEGETVLTRRWSWRQANHSLTLPETTAIQFNLDGLAPVARAELEAIGAELADGGAVLRRADPPGHAFGGRAEPLYGAVIRSSASAANASAISRMS